MRADPVGTLAGEVAELKDVAEMSHGSGTTPVIDGGQTLAGKLGIGRRFEPTDGGHRIVILPREEGAELPCSRPGTVRAIAEAKHGLSEREGLATFGERMFPV